MATILVVDDDPSVRQTVEAILASAGHRVVLAAGGHEALRLFGESPGFDLVVMDILMPEGEGIESIIAIHERDRSARILAISGGGYVSAGRLLELAGGLGIAGTLPKPFDRTQLLQAVDRCLPAELRGGAPARAQGSLGPDRAL